MRTVQVGEIKTSVLGFGCASVMGRVGRRDSLRAMEAAWEAGVTLFDTARSYGYGEAEGLLGEFLAGRRAQATVVTKFGILPGRPARWKRVAKPLVRGALRMVPQARGLVRRGVAGEMSGGHFDAVALRRSVEESLRQLRTEYVDILLAHEAPASLMVQEDLMAELGAIVREGKARRVGISGSREVAGWVMRGGCGVLQAVQFPAGPLGDGVVLRPEAGWFRMANHPVGGTAGAALQQLRVLSRDVRVEAPLREKLLQGGEEALVEVVLGHALRQADVVVPSMLQLEHVRANGAAVANCRFSVEEVERLRTLVLSVR
jgi:diketogulonate reductase-like aldo/keto reductase